MRKYIDVNQLLSFCEIHTIGQGVSGKLLVTVGETKRGDAIYKDLLEFEEIYTQLERPQGGWIPVSERLPEENGEYLVTREAYIDREHRNMVFVRDIASFTINFGYNNGFHKASTVIAWQPLPEPYKKEGTK